MHSPPGVLCLLFLSTLLPFPFSTAQFQSDFEKRKSASQVSSYASRPSRYQIPQNGYNYYLQKQYSRSEVDNAVESRRNGPRISNSQDKTRYNMPFYDSIYKRKQTLSSPRPYSGIGHKFPLIPYVSERNQYEKPFYDSKGIVKQAFWSPAVQNHVERARNFLWKANHYQRPFFNSNFKMLLSARSSNAPRFPYASKSHQRSSILTYRPLKGKYQWNKYFRGNSQPRRSFVSNADVQQKLSTQNGIDRRKVPWVEQNPAMAHYRALSYIPNHLAYRSSFSNQKATLHSDVLNSPYGKGLERETVSSEQHGGIPYIWERKKSYIFPLPPPDSTDPSLTSNYHLEPKSKIQNYGDLYNNGDVALQSVFPQLSQGEDGLISEKMSDQQATSRTGDVAYSMVKGPTRLAPRKSYVTASLNERLGQLNDPMLIKLKSILQSLRKRSTKNIDDKQVVYSTSNTGAFHRGRRHAITGTYNLYKDNLNSEKVSERKSAIDKEKGGSNWGFLNDFSPNIRLASMILLKQKRDGFHKRDLHVHSRSGTYNLYKDNLNSEKVSERKSAIDKEKGGSNWGFLNDFSPNIRLASMILLKQKRDGFHKRDLHVHSRSLGKSSGKENPLAERSEQETIARTTQNQPKQGMLFKNQSRTSLVPTIKSLNTTMPARATQKGSQKMHKRKNSKTSRHFIQDRISGAYIYPAKKYGHGTFWSPYGTGPDHRQMMQFLDSKEQFQAQQMEMENRLRAMRSRGLLNSLAFINPHFVSRPPLPYPMMPFQQQQYDYMERKEFPARRFPFRNSLQFMPTANYNFFPIRNLGFFSGMREPDIETNIENELQEKSEYPAESDQGSVVENNLNFPSFPPPQEGVKELSQNDQSSLDGRYPQVIQVEANKLYRDIPNGNTSPYDDRIQGSSSYISPQLTSMQAVNQPLTMSHKWFPIGKNKMSLMADPRKVSSQWPSRLPGLERALTLNILQGRGYFPSIYNPVLRGVYKDTEAHFQPFYDNRESYSGFSKYGSGIERESKGFSRRNQITLPTHKMEVIKKPRKKLANKTKGEGIQVTRESSSVLKFKEHLARRNGLHHPLIDSKRGENSSEKLHHATEQIVNPKINLNKTTHRSLANRPKSKGRVTRNYVNMVNYALNHRMLPNIRSFAPLYTPVGLGSDRGVSWEQLMATKTPFEGYLVKGRLSGFGNSIRKWPLGSERQFNQVDVPQPMTYLSHQQVAQIPETSFSRDNAQMQAPYAESMTAFQSNGNEESNEPHQTPEYYANEEKETEHNGPEIITLPSNYAGGENGVTQNLGNPFDGGPAYPEQSITELKPSAESAPENGLAESSLSSRRDLTDSGETFAEKDDMQGDTHDTHFGTDATFTPGLLDGLDNTQASLLQRQIEGRNPDREGPLGFSDRFHFMPRPQAFIHQRAHYRSKGIGNNLGIRDGHRIRLPNLSLDSIEKMVDSASMGNGKAAHDMNGLHRYGSKSKGSVDQAGLDDNQDWKSALMNQSPTEFNSQLENAMLQWNSATKPHHKTASSSESSLDSSSDTVSVPSTSATDSQDIVPGITFDTQGQRPGPLFMSKAPPGLESDSSFETVLMVPPQGKTLQEQSGTKKATIHRKEVQHENTTKSRD